MELEPEAGGEQRLQHYARLVAGDDRSGRDSAHLVEIVKGEFRSSGIDLKSLEVVRFHNEEYGVVAAVGDPRARDCEIADALQRAFVRADRGDFEARWRWLGVKRARGQGEEEGRHFHIFILKTCAGWKRVRNFRSKQRPNLPHWGTQPESWTNVVTEMYAADGPGSVAVRIHPGASEALVSSYEEIHQCHIADLYRLLLQQMNGAHLFEISLFGVPPTMGRRPP